MARAWQIAVAVLVITGISFFAAGFWIPAKAMLAQYLLQRAWQEGLATGGIIKPWPWADTWPVGRLQNARLGVDLIVLEGSSGEVLAFGPGHLAGSGSPAGPGHCMLAGHRDTSFAFLESLQPGDILTLTGKTGKASYQVDDAGVARAEDLYLDGQREGMLTLITCFPFRAVRPGTPFRFVVTAIRDPGGPAKLGT